MLHLSVLFIFYASRDARHSSVCERQDVWVENGGSDRRIG